MTAASDIRDADLHAYVDGQLSPRDSEIVRRHLARDAGAASRAERWEKQREALRARLSPIVDEALPLRLRIARLRAAADREARSKIMFSTGFIAGALFGGAVAAMVLIRAL